MKECSIKVSKKMPEIAKLINDKIVDTGGERLGFTLIIFTDERASYISNCNRKLSTEAIKHLLDCWEKDMPDIPAHNYQS